MDNNMKNKVSGQFALAAAAVLIAAVTLPAQAKQCSLASAAGHWAYTYNGTVYAPDAAPIAAVGTFLQDAKGNVTGSQTHTLAGQTEVEDITATAAVNSDCTGSATISVYLDG